MAEITPNCEGFYIGRQTVFSINMDDGACTANLDPTVTTYIALGNVVDKSNNMDVTTIDASTQLSGARMDKMAISADETGTFNVTVPTEDNPTAGADAGYYGWNIMAHIRALILEGKQPYALINIANPSDGTNTGRIRCWRVLLTGYAESEPNGERVTVSFDWTTTGKDPYLEVPPAVIPPVV